MIHCCSADDIVCRVLPVDAGCVRAVRPSSGAASPTEIRYGDERRTDGRRSKQNATKYATSAAAEISSLLLTEIYVKLLYN